MKRKDLIPALVMVVLLAVAGLVWFAPWPGQAAPAVELRTLDGERIDLASLEGRPALVQFWATSCVTCVAEIPHLKALYQDLAADGLVMVGVAMEYDPPKHVARMVEEKSLPYPIALDRDGRVAQAFGDVQLTPTTVLIDPHGRIAWKRIGELDFDRLNRQIRDMLGGQTAG